MAVSSLLHLHPFFMISACTAYNICGSCWPNDCFAIANYTLYKVKNYGEVSGIDKMKAEIYNNGPIAYIPLLIIPHPH